MQKELSTKEQIIKIIGQRTVEKYLKAILLCRLLEDGLELEDREYFSNTSEKEQKTEDDYIQWIGLDGNGGKSLEELTDFLPSREDDIEHLEYKNRYSGNLKDVIYEFEQAPIVVKFIGIDGLPYIVLYVTKQGTPRPKLANLCEPKEKVEKIIFILAGEDKEITI